MGKQFIVNILGILLSAYLISWSSNYIKEAKEEFSRIQLSAAIDHASNAAVESLIESRDLSVDYEDYNFISADPKQALDVFVDIFLINMGMSVSKENKQMVKTAYMPTFVVALTDGYHIAKQVKITDGTIPEYDLILGPKLGYTYRQGNSTYGLLQGGKYYYEIGDTTDVKRIEGLPPGLTTIAQVHDEINTIITSSMKSTIDSYQEENTQGWESEFYLPGELTSSGINAIDGPTVITLLQGVDITTTEPIDSYSITGTKIQGARMIVAYRYNGIKYYAYQGSVLPVGSIVDEVYTSMGEAARKGYMADIDTLSKR